jgi:class 3 adenylate cyclase
LLLELLELLARGALSGERIVAGLSRRSTGLVIPARRIGPALEALDAEALIESQNVRGRVVYRTTTTGIKALEERGRYSGIVAVLFTDLVGSTGLIEAFGEAAAHRLRRRHFLLLREAIAAHGGREVKSLGDGLMVVFGDARRAVGCAQAMQRAVVRDRDGLGLRIGIDAGEPVREGDDFFGTPVIVARRLCDAARGGQIVVSERVHELADEQGGGEYEPLGALSLKGLSEPVPARALRWTLRREPAVDGARVRRRAGAELPVPRTAPA